MGSDIKSLRIRIRSVDSTLHLTKAMGLVASSKIRRANEAMNRGREYELAVKDVVSTLAASGECRKSPYMRSDEGGKTLFVVIAGDRGLAGGYNANVFRKVREFPDAQILPIGKRACDRYGGEFISSEKFTCEKADEMAAALCRDHRDGKFDRLGVICTKYVSMLSQIPEIRWIFPLTPREDERPHGMVFEPDERTILDAAVPVYVAGMLVSAVRESFASEVAARRAAMDSAGKNAQQMIDDLQLSYNRARQGAITQEITEIVAGSGM